MLEVKNVTVGYDGIEVLSGFSLTLDPGELVALVGDNGSGKSTLGRAMCAAQLADEGSVVVDGHDPSISELERLFVRSLVGRLGQDPVDQIVSALVFDDIAFGPRNLGLDESEVEHRVHRALELVGMPGFIDRVTTELSGGEQQRIALAGVLAMEPRYLVLDEPAAQLDPSARSSMRELFARLSHEGGMGIALITHDASEIALCDRIVSVGGSNTGLEVEEPDAASSHNRHGSGAAGFGCESAVLELRDVSFSYGNSPVLSSVSFSICPGEVVLLEGASGAGKSTLASIAAGLRAPDEGTALVLGEQATPSSVGIAFQSPESQFFLDTVHEEIAFAPRNAGVCGSELDARVRHASCLVGLDEELLERFPFELSGGQARRVALASVLSLDAPAYILDEPSAALDAQGRAFAHQLVRTLSQGGRGVLVITHDVDEWSHVATRTLRLEAGRVSEGSSEQGAQASGKSQSLESRSKDQSAVDDSRNYRKRAQGPLRPFGGYIANSPLARVDARVKIALLFAASAAVFASSSVVALLPWFALLGVCLCSARMDPRTAMRGLRPVALVLLFTLLANAVSCDGSADVVLAASVGIDKMGAIRGVMAVLRIALLVGFSICVASSTTGTQISDAVVRLLSPLVRVGAPVAPLGMVLSLALRFIPLVSEELSRIRLAQRARGARFDEGALTERISVWASVLTPLMVGLFRRADRLAEAMSARCYDAVAAGRLPSARPLGKRDVLVLVGGFALIIVCVLL